MVTTHDLINRSNYGVGARLSLTLFAHLCPLFDYAETFFFNSLYVVTWDAGEVTTTKENCGGEKLLCDQAPLKKVLFLPTFYNFFILF